MAACTAAYRYRRSDILLKSKFEYFSQFSRFAAPARSRAGGHPKRLPRNRANQSDTEPTHPVRAIASTLVSCDLSGKHLASPGGVGDGDSYIGQPIAYATVAIPSPYSLILSHDTIIHSHTNTHHLIHSRDSSRCAPQSVRIACNHPTKEPNATQQPAIRWGVASPW